MGILWPTVLALAVTTSDPARLRAVSWFGMETETMAPHGLWARPHRDLLRQIRLLGFDAVRLPFSNAALAPGAAVSGVDFTKNPELEGKTPLEVLDVIVRAAERAGLAVILDRHRPTPEGQSELWYTDQVDERRWIADWVVLARRYRDSPAVVGFELHNEPHGAATWGSGDLSTDWRLAAERAGEAILAVNPRAVLFVQGIENGYWWGGNLAAAAEAPVRLSLPGRVVYVAHDYPPSVHRQPWFDDAAFPKNLPSVWDRYWGKIAPVFLGEFGTRLATDDDRQWLSTLVRYVGERRLGFGYWSLNPNSADTGGLLQDDWVTGEKAKLAALRPLLSP